MIIKGQFCLFLHKNICCGYSLESPRPGDSNEYQLHMFLWRTDKNYTFNYHQIPSLSVLLKFPWQKFTFLWHFSTVSRLNLKTTVRSYHNEVHSISQMGIYKMEGYIILYNHYLGCVKQIWYLSPMRTAKVQASLRIRAVSPEPLLLAHTSSESRETVRQKARSLAPLNGWACAIKICHDGML